MARRSLARAPRSNRRLTVLSVTLSRALGWGLFALLAAPSAPLAAAICTVDTQPGATLLLPYFEVDLDNPDGLTTLFSVNNASATVVLAHVVVWSDLAVPVMNFNLYLTGNDVQSLNLRDLLVAGRLPQTASSTQDPNDIISPKGQFSQDLPFPSCTGQLPPPPLPADFLAGVQLALTGRSSPLLSGQCAGRYLGDNIARGYVTVDTVNNCTLRVPGDPGYFGAAGTGDVTDQNVLWGAWFIVNSTQNYAEGADLVPIEADAGNPAVSSAGRYTFYGRYDGWTGIDHREPLATRFATQYLSGGLFDGGTDLLVWRDPKVAQEPFTCPAVSGISPAWYPLDEEGLTIFDEQEHPLVPQLFPCAPVTCPQQAHPFTAAAQRVKVGGADFPVPFNFGWLEIDLNQATAAAGNNPPGDPGAAQAWVVATLTSHGHYAVTLDAFRLDSACAASHFLP
ncbi:MAG TPA: hypothetical protein VOA87_15775 [Thermoanaerobaculia bacterium]|nr:hypothetical protein [Thermoanaerobaculia bacterium]